MAEIKELSSRAFKKVLKYEQEPVQFSYVKKDGTVRVAHGTRNFDLIPEEAYPKSGIEDVPNIVRYYDTDKQGWRSCIAENLISFIANTGKEIKIVPLTEIIEKQKEAES